MKKRNDTLLAVSLFVLFLSVLVLLSPDDQQLTGAVTSDATTSRVEVTAFFAIALSNNLSEGIDFGSVITVPVNDVNATGNYNQSNNITLYYVAVSNDSNTPVDICIQGTNLTNAGGAQIPLPGYTWQVSDNQSITNLTQPPGPAGSISLAQAYALAQANITPGNQSYFRFWLDIPPAQEVGIYNNTVSFKGKIFGSC